MDAGNMIRLASLLKTFAARGHGIIVVTHDAQFLARACSRVLLLDRGRVALERALSRPDPGLINYLTQGIMP